MPNEELIQQGYFGTAGLVGDIAVAGLWVDSAPGPRLARRSARGQTVQLVQLRLASQDCR
jgi:hypothetical protein